MGIFTRENADAMGTILNDLYDLKIKIRKAEKEENEKEAIKLLELFFEIKEFGGKAKYPPTSLEKRGINYSLKKRKS